MRRFFALLVVCGCHAVGQTGPRGMVGVLVDVDGRPIAGIDVTTEEHGVVTDPEGNFEVRWKEPSTFLTFRVGGVQWKRSWLPDDPPTTRLQLPRLGAGEVLCRVDADCMAEVTWEAGPALQARVDVPCGTKTPVARIEGIPTTLPKVRCATLMGEVDFLVAEESGRLLIRGKPQPIPVKLVGPASSAGCSLSLLDGEVVTGGGRIGLQPSTDTWAWATCSGRAGTPMRISPRPTGMSDEQATVAIPWFATGADLTLAPPLPAPATLNLVRMESGIGAGEVGAWRITVEPGGDGTYRLPPLPRGEYRLGFGAPALLSSVNPPSPEIPGTVVFQWVPGNWGIEGGMVGSLRLEENLPSGPLLVDGYPPPPAAP